MIARAIAAALTIAFFISPAPAEAQRLPSGYSWGRCLLVVDGETRISGKCSYQIEAGGEFFITGPRQYYGSKEAFGDATSSADQQSTDYWARVYKDGDAWTGYGNSSIESVHGDVGPEGWGELRRQGACYIGKDVKVCLWRQ